MNKKNRPVIPETVKNKNNKINKECAGMKKLIKVKDVNGKLVVSSREVAENFGKTHSHVLRDLDRIISEEPDLSTQIVLGSYKTKGNNKTYKEYLLTEEGLNIYFATIVGYGKEKKEFLNRLGFQTQLIELKRFELSFGELLQETLKPLNISIETQKSVFGRKYRIDFYLPEFNLAIEYDEEHHNEEENKIKDNQREEEIKNELHCEFIRLDYRETDAYNVGLVLKKIFNR